MRWVSFYYEVVLFAVVMIMAYDNPRFIRGWGAVLFILGLYYFYRRLKDIAMKKEPSQEN